MLGSSPVVRQGELPGGGGTWGVEPARQSRGRVFLAQGIRSGVHSTTHMGTGITGADPGRGVHPLFWE